MSKFQIYMLYVLVRLRILKDPKNPKRKTLESWFNSIKSETKVKSNAD